MRAGVTGAARLVGALALAGTLGGCRSAEPAPPLEALRAEVAALREQAAGVIQDDTLPGAGRADSGALYVGLATPMLRSVLSEAARAYLQDVRLHVQPDAVARAGDEVRVRAGPIGVTAGRWDLTVRVERVDALLGADSLSVTVADSTRLDVRVPIHVRDATGEVLLDFSWDAARVAGVVCGDFRVRERFSGVVEPHTILVEGFFEIESGPEGTVARPVVSQRIPVSPQPTPASWQRVRAILAEQDKLGNCGLALSPDRVEQQLRRLLTRGFSFPLPSSVLRPVTLPTSLASEVQVAGRRARVRVEPVAPVLSERWLWFGAEVTLEPLAPLPGG